MDRELIAAHCLVNTLESCVPLLLTVDTRQELWAVSVFGSHLAVLQLPAFLWSSGLGLQVGKSGGQSGRLLRFHSL